MAMFAPIPLPGMDNPQFKDVMDYFDTLKQAQDKRNQYAQANSLEKQKLDELAKYHQQSLAQEGSLNPLKMELLRAKIESLKNGGGALSVQDKATQKLNAKRMDDIEKQAGELSGHMSQAADASNILDKNNAATGYAPAFQNLIGKGSGETGALKDIFGNLQASLGKDFSSRGSVYGTKLAGNMKPSLLADYESNTGNLNQIHKDYYRRWKLMNDDYKRLSGGRELPYTLNDFYNKVKVRSPQGHEVVKSPDEAAALIQKYPGSQIIGNAYE